MSNNSELIKNFKLSQISMMKSKEYAYTGGVVIEVEDDPNDIHKLFPKHTVIYFKIDYRSNWNGRGYNYDYTYNPELEIFLHDNENAKFENYRYRNFKEKQLTITVDNKPTFTHASDSSKLYIDNIRVEIVNNGRRNKMSIVDNNGSLFIKHFNWLWSIETEAKTNCYLNEGNVTAMKMLDFLKTLKVDNMNDDYRKRIINQFINLDTFKLPTMPGISKTMKQIDPFYKHLISDSSENILRITAFTELYLHCSKVVKSIKVSVIFNNLFGTITTQEQFDAVCDDIKQYLFKGGRYYYFQDYFDLLTQNIDSAKEIRKDSLKRKATGSFNKIMQDIDFIAISEESHPLTYNAIHSGELPTGIFFRKSGDSYFIYNDNWDVWELALASNYVDEIKVIAKAASGRSTFEKDIMSYLNFTFVTLPEYLEKHTGKKWKGIPKFVNSTERIEAPKEGSGTIKTRSALTPIVDNESNTITVPYAAIVSSGSYGSTYCYAHDYNILTRNYTLEGNVITRELEKALNGRDDYGLMFYTLTGSTSAQGYPTFLIIFERLDDKTTVHFHRTHPMRSKDGEPNPINNWIRGCYKWMIGNVNFDKIAAQQGDLAFVSIDKFPDGEPTKVDQYDSHRFERDVDYLPYTKKDKANVLGYVNLTEDTKLNHTHHRQRVIPAGVYEIRQCRSWEANPTGVWSLRID